MKWWNGLDVTEKGTWLELMKAFDKKWPRPKPTRRRLLGELVGGDKEMMLRSAVRGTLPLELRHLINDDDVDDWDDVEGVSVKRIGDAVEARNEHHSNIVNEELAFHRANPNATGAASCRNADLTDVLQRYRATTATPRGTHLPLPHANVDRASPIPQRRD
jgi:hypothetical protein